MYRLVAVKARQEVFLSYAREDEATVAEVYRLLKARGFQPWMDTRDIAGGEDWGLAIQRAMRRANFVLVFISHSSLGKPGVLQDEIKAGLLIREANLEGERFVIPVRLEKCEIPESLKPYQWINYFDRDGRPRLLKALGYQPVRPWIYAGALIILAALAVSFWWGRAAGRSPVDQFVSGREVKGNEAPVGNAWIGITLLELRPTKATDAPSVREIIHPPAEPSAEAEHLTPVRSRMKLALPVEAKFRIGIESSQSGYLYVIDRAQYGDQWSPPVMIFPTTRIRSGDNLISRGSYIELPSDYWAFQSTRPGYRGEQITILLTPAALPVSIGADEANLDPELFAKWEREWSVPARLVATQIEDSDVTATPGEAAARNRQFQRLSSKDPAPQYLYELPAKSPAMFHFPLSVAK